MKVLSASPAPESPGRGFDPFGRFWLAALLLLACVSTSGVTLTPPVVATHTISFSFDSAADRLFTVQSSTSAESGWTDDLYLPGTGGPIGFSAPVEGASRYFRVRSTPWESLNVRPATPALVDGTVSLPDATEGSPYLLQVSSALTGLPPYSLQVEGSPPQAVELIVVSNETANASVQVRSTGSGLVPGQRRQFAITVVDWAGTTLARRYDLRVVAPAPRFAPRDWRLKAGEPASLQLTAEGGTEPLSWSVKAGGLPEGMTLSPGGLLSGTPSAGAAEFHEDGMYTNVIEVADHYSDPVNGNPSPRTSSNTVQSLVRLSYVLNVRATRDDGPSLRQTCFACHGPGFEPNFEPDTLSTLVNVSGRAGSACGPSHVYVSPGDLSNSLVYLKLGEVPPCGDRMPFSGPYMSDTPRARLARWIRELTPTDTD